MPDDTYATGFHGSSNSFAHLLRSLRTCALLSQEQLARQSGLSVRTIRDLEGGHVACPRGESVRLLADALQLTGAARREFELLSRPPQASQPPAGGHSVVGYPGDGPRPAGRAAAAFGVPAQLPMDTPAFAGRTDELAQLDTLLERTVSRPATVGVAALSGGAGVGKTTLAIHWAHGVRDAFPDGQMYLDLRGYGPRGKAVSSVRATQSLLGLLGLPRKQIPDDPDAQESLYRSTLSGRQTLIVLDNARNATQVRPLLPGTPGCMVVVTSRNQLVGLVAVESAQPITVGRPSVADARTMIVRRLGAGRVQSELATVDEIIHRCARLPLAMAGVAGRFAIRSQFSLTALVASELGDTCGSLDLLGGDIATAVRTSFSWSYATLSRDAAQVFRLFGGDPPADLTSVAAAGLASIPEPRARAALAELTQGNMVEERAPGAFNAHRLLRAYASELARPAER